MMFANNFSVSLACIVAFRTTNGRPWSSFTPSLRTSEYWCASHAHAPRKRCDPSMKIKAGLVGLPNTGKSSLFNAIAQKSIAEAKNFPFCTIEPNVMPVPIPDARLHELAKLAKSEKALPANIFLVDVAGLVKGASRGEGMGNRFLATVRECDLIIHVIRNFIAADVIHVDGIVDPVADAEVVNLELLLADLSHVQRRLKKNMCSGTERDVLLKVEKGLEDGLPARTLGLSSRETLRIKSMGLLTLKPVVYAFNLDEVDFILNKDESVSLAEEYMRRIQYCDLETDSYLVVSAKLESELGSLSIEERNEYLESIGIESNMHQYTEYWSFHTLPLLVKDVMDLALVYTGPGVPPERSRTTKTHILASNSMTALDLAGNLHGDIQKGFMHAEVINSAKLIHNGSYNEAKKNGCVGMEGKEYLLQGDDVVLIKWK